MENKYFSHMFLYLLQNDINMADSAKFFFYELKALGANKKEIEIKDVLENKGFMELAKKTPIEDKEEKILYEFYFTQMGNDFYYGRIIRTKSPGKYFIKKGYNVLEKLMNLFKLGKTERIGEMDLDISHFIMKLQKDRIIVLMQTGYKIAGMGKLKMFMEKILDKEADEICYKAIVTEKVRNALKLLKDKKVKSIKLKFRKTPEIPQNTIIEQTIKNIHSAVTDNYIINISIGVGKMGKKTIETLPLFGSIYSKFFGRDINPDDIDIDFPDFLSQFEVEYLTKSENLVEKEDILERYENVQINIDSLSLDNDEEVSKTLLRLFQEKLKLG